MELACLVASAVAVSAAVAEASAGDVALAGFGSSAAVLDAPAAAVVTSRLRVFETATELDLDLSGVGPTAAADPGLHIPIWAAVTK